jgi:hypothetical protein
MSEFKKTICLDFDGVIHSYVSGWKGASNIPDLPVVGTKEAIEKLRETWKVVVYSSRSSQEGGLEAMKEWFKEHDIEVDDLCAHKPPAFVYVDDRGVTFKGCWNTLISDINGFQQWQKAGV